MERKEALRPNANSASGSFADFRLHRERRGGDLAFLTALLLLTFLVLASASCSHRSHPSKSSASSDAGSRVKSKSELVEETIDSSNVLFNFTVHSSLLEEIVVSFPEVKRSVARIAVVEAFEKAAIRKSVVGELMKLSIDELQTVRDWFRSPLGQAYLTSIETARLATRSQYVIRHKDSEGDTPGKASSRFRFLSNPKVRELQKLEDIFLYWIVLHAGNVVRPASERLGDDKISKVAAVMYSKDEDERRSQAERLTELQSQILNEAQWRGVVEFHETSVVREFLSRVRTGVAQRVPGS